MAANFSWNITVGADGVINAVGAQDPGNGFLGNNSSSPNSRFTFSSPTVIGTVAIATTEASFSYQYGWYGWDQNSQNFFTVTNEGTANRTTDIAMSGSSDILRALAAGQIRDVTVTYVFYPQYFYNDFPSSFGIETGGTSGQATFRFTGVNEAPILNDTARTLFSVQEDAAAPSGFVGTSVFSLLASGGGGNPGITDYDSGAALGIAITGTDSANGTWWFSTNGSTWSQVGSVSDSNARLLSRDSLVYFRPNANFNGTLDNAITFRAWDTTQGTNGNTFNTTSNGGTTAFSTVTDTASLTVNAVNDLPSVTSIATLNYTENQSATLLAPSASITDIDSPNFNNGFLKASFTANGTAADQLSIVTDEHVSLTGNVVSVDGTDIGTLASSGANGSALQVNLNSAATPALVQVLMRHIAYENTSDNPATTARTVKFEVADNFIIPGSTTSTINVTATNDAPVINGVTFAVAEGGTTVLSAANFNIIDPDNTSHTYTVSNLTHGMFQTTTDGVIWTNATTFTTAMIAADHVRFVHDGGEAAPTFSIQANDGAAASNLSGVVAGAVNFTPVNDAPFTPAALVLDFEDISHPLDGGFTPLASYDTNGFVFSSTHSGADAFESFHMGHVFYPGSAALANSYAGALTRLQRSDDSVFDIDRIDLDSFLPGASSQVTFTGTLARGGTVQQTFTLDGLRGFQTFSFSADFDHVVSIAWDQVSPYNVFDNIRLNPAAAVASITEEDTDNAGQTVAFFLKNIADPDAGALQGIAITAAANGNGHWEYSTGGAWTAFDAVSDSHALLLRGSDIIRFVPNGVTGTNASFEFHAWDQSGVTVGQEGTYADLTSIGTGGSDPFSTATQSASIIVTDVNDTPTGQVIITGTAAENQTLTASNTLADIDGLGTVTYQWQRNGADIAGATGQTHLLGDADVGKAITVRAIYTDGRGAAESVSSTATASVTNVNDLHTGDVTIAGSAIENGTMTASNTLADDDGIPPGAISYRWQRNGSEVMGANASTYVLGDADVGKTISVRAIYTDAHGTTEWETSAATAAVANVNDAPTGVVTITGIATENQTLAAGNTLTDADGLGTISYQWQRNGVDVAGATGATYLLGDADVGATIRVRANYTDARATAESVTSAATAAVANVNDAPTGVVTIGGTATENQILTVSNTLADADGMGTVSYQWQRNGTDVAGATGTTYQLGNPDVGATIRVRATYTDGHGTTEPVNSAATAAITNVNDVPAGFVMISGTAIENQTLTASNTLTDADGLGTIAYRWQRGGVDIGGATNASYTLGDADVGAVITVKASYLDGHGTIESVVSAPIGAVANVNDAPAGTVTITGAATEDVTLTASNTLTDADGLGTISYRWQRDGDDIAGATSSTYKLTDADVGKSITVKASYVDGHGTAQSVTSAATAAVANVNDAPAGVVTIVGSPIENQTLTAINTLTDADGLGAISYQWQRNGVDVGGATGTTYLLGDADVGATIRVRAIYTDARGAPESMTSAPTAAVANVNDAPSGALTIDGTATEGQTLEAESALADQDGITTISYQWLRDGVAIDGATGATYTLGDADVDSKIAVKVSYVDGHGTGEPVTSAQTATVANVNDAPTGDVTISGSAIEYQTLTVLHTLGDDDGLGAISYRWQRNGVDVGGATGTTYALDDIDVGSEISVRLSYVDGHGTPELVTSAATALVANVNDAPVLASASPTLDGIDEDETDDDGQTVASFIGLTISDADALKVSGIAITGMTGDNGHWEYSLDGTTWEEIETVSESSALLLASSDFIRFVPNEENGTTATLSYRAWDQTGSELAGDTADTTTNGGTTPFSTVFNTATLVVASVNDDAEITTAPGIRMSETNLPSTISFNLADKVTVTDVDDEDAPVGYVANSGTVSADGPTPPSDTLLDLLSFNALTGAVSFDRSAFNWLADDECVEYTITFDARSGDDTPEEQTFTITIRGKNDAPILSSPSHQTFVPMTEDDGPSAPRTVLSFRGPISDDDHAAYTGIAITGTQGEGKWEFSLDDGATWECFTACPEEALLLRDTDLLRFVPDAKNGGEASFTYKAWDQTSCGEAGCFADTTPSGGTTAFSAASDTITLAVASINDAPVMRADFMELFDITEDEVDNIGQDVWSFLCNAISDVDFDAVEGIALTGTTNGHWEYSLDGGLTWLAVGEVDEDDALLLREDDWMRFVPDGKNGTTATLTYHAWDQTDGAAGDRVDLATDGATGGTTAYSADTDTVSIAVSGENDAPVVSGPVTLAPEKEGTARLITQANLLVNTSDIDLGAALEATELEISAGKGQLTDNGDGTWTYTPEGDDDTQVSFTFKVGDGIAAAIAAAATMDITPVNDAPESANDIVGGNEDAPITSSVSATDIDSQALIYSIVTQAQHGIVSMNPNGSYSYVPFANFNGTDSFTFAAFDGFANSIATLDIVVNAINDAPVHSLVTQLSVEAGYDIPITGLSISDVDVGAASLTTTLSAVHGTLKVGAFAGVGISGNASAAVTLTGTLTAINGALSAANNVIYRTDAGFTGNDALTLVTSDNGSAGAGGTLADIDSMNLFWQHFVTGDSNDGFTALSGYSRIDAGGGTDTVTFNSKLTDATFSWVGNQVIVNVAGSQTILTGVEVFNFTDGTVNNNDGNVLVDDLFYYATYHDVWNARVDADAHYNTFGWHEGRDPNAFFDTKGYLATYTDVAAAKVNPLDHYATFGWHEGRDPSTAFDVGDYLSHYADVAAAGVEPLAHFLLFGAQEHRTPFNDGAWG